MLKTTLTFFPLDISGRQIFIWMYTYKLWPDCEEIIHGIQSRACVLSLILDRGRVVMFNNANTFLLS